MEISKEIMDEVYRELIEEFKVPIKTKGTKTFDEIEGMVLQFGKKFERRVIERSIEDQRRKAEQKKTAQNVARD